MNPQFVIDNPLSMSDEPIAIALEGVPSDALITIEAQSSDYYGINALPDVSVGSSWTSKSLFKSSTSGKINLETDAALSGSYRGIHGMGLLYTMKPLIKKTKKRALDLASIPVYKNYHIRLSAYQDKKLLCEKVIEKKYQNNNIVYQDVLGKYSVARFFKNKHLTDQPAVIVLSGSDGRIEKAQAIAQALASHGFAALAVCYFGLKGTPSSLANVPLESIKESISFLKQQDSVNSQKIAVYGRSKGGELALLSGSIFPEITCVIANTPSSFIFEGLNERHRNSKSSSWSYHNQPLPYIPFNFVNFIPYIIKKTVFKKNDLASVYEKLLSQRTATDARIAVENINGSVLFISSKNDEIWPSTLLCNKAMEQLEAHHFPYKHEHSVYQNSGHHLTIAYQPNPRYSQHNCLNHLADGVDSWEKTLTFLKNWR